MQTEACPMGLQEHCNMSLNWMELYLTNILFNPSA
jgi:hypothetical protein